MFASFNRFELDLPLSIVVACSQPGQDASSDVEQALRDIKLLHQLDQMDTEDIREELAEYGAWDEEQLADDEENLRRLVWVAAGQLRDELFQALSGLECLTEKDVREILRRCNSSHRDVPKSKLLEGAMTNANTLRIVSGQGTPILVRLLYEGDEYGKNDCCINDGPPLVEFFDARQARKLFVSRYRVSSFLEHRGGVNLSPGTHGLILDRYDVEIVQHWLNRRLAERPE